jgi:DNA invertase Pin-like site-specific DNA recombinase
MTMSVAHSSDDPIPAVAYLRKSTKGERKGQDGKARQKQEKSLAQQREEILKLAARGGYRVLAWFEDDGVSGYKRGPARPDFNRMKDEAATLGARAILCDAIDRFSRACYDDVQEDARALRKAGVRWVVTSTGKQYDLDAGRKNDVGGIVILACDACAAAEYSKTLSRRVTLARRNAALEGRRTGGRVPYGLADDGAGGLVPGDPARAEVVRWLFDQVVHHLRGLCWLAQDLNDRRIPTPSGKIPPANPDDEGERWYPRTVAVLLAQPAYKGDFTFNRKHYGFFHGIDHDGEVVEAAELNGTRKVYHKAGAYEPLVDPDVWARAQERVQVLGAQPGRSRRKYALAGVLVCDHCGSGMVGCTVEVGVVYRCNARARGVRCRQYQIRESAILPFLVERLGREVDSLSHLATLPPEELTAPDREKEKARGRLQADRDRLAAKVERAEVNLLELTDPRNVKALEATLSGWRDELDRLDSELAVPPTRGGFTQEQVEALARWHEEFAAQAIQVVGKWGEVRQVGVGESAMLVTSKEIVLAEPRKVNDALLTVGCEVRLRFQETGKPCPLLSGRFRLGQQKGNLPKPTDTSAHRGGSGAGRPGPGARHIPPARGSGRRPGRG